MINKGERVRGRAQTRARRRSGGSGRDNAPTGYRPLFDWRALERERPARPDEAVGYIYDDDLALAVNVALAARRPLLLSGAPGTGKSTLAADVAWKLGRRFYTEVITSRTKAQDLQWSFDAVRRLALATSDVKGKATKVAEQKPFVRPGVLWRAFEPLTAGQHGDKLPARAWGDRGAHAVVLLDEIDKAEPDVPNDLLVVLDQREFVVRETGTKVEAPPELEVLIVITTNGERDLPPAFLRRCIAHTIKPPGEPRALEERLKQIAKRHFDWLDDGLFAAVYGLYGALRTASASAKVVREPSTAELLDALRACAQLGIRHAGDALWQEIATKAMWKHAEAPELPVEASTPAGGTPRE